MRKNKVTSSGEAIIERRQGHVKASKTKRPKVRSARQLSGEAHHSCHRRTPSGAAPGLELTRKLI